MGLLFVGLCFIIVFSPSFVLFAKVVSKDPLRIILFVLGYKLLLKRFFAWKNRNQDKELAKVAKKRKFSAFFWLIAHLLCSIVWLSFGRPLVISLFLSAILQELARGGYYLLLHKAQSGLAKLARQEALDDSGAKFIHSSRHIFAVVCGLGMGVMAALFLLLNILAMYAKDGVVGLPSALLQNPSDSSEFQLTARDAFFPIHYSLACGILILLNVCWTVILWDGLHKLCFRSPRRQWLPPILFTFLSHLLSTAIGIGLAALPFVKILALTILLAADLAYCLSVVRLTSSPFLLIGGRGAAQMRQRRLEVVSD